MTPLNDGTVIIDGSANVREINKAFNWHLPEDEARTVNGIILEALEEIPVPGTRVRIEPVSYTHLILSLPRYHPDGRKVRPASSVLVQVA